MMKPSVLILLHNPLVRDAISLFVKGEGYDVDLPEDHLQYDLILKQVEQKVLLPYAVIMDLNYGRAGGEDITPARVWYDFCRQRDIPFLGLSGHPIAVDLAHDAGIPAALKGRAQMYDSLEKLIQRN